MIPKFRCWHKELSKMSDSFTVFDIADGYDDGFCIRVNDSDLMGDYPGKNNNIEIMQWSGLTDKNGKDIFDGDIVKGFCIKHFDQPDIENKLMEASKIPIYFVHKPNLQPNLQWWLGTKKTNTALNDFDQWDLEVIGNVWENPELLKDSESVDSNNSLLSLESEEQTNA